MRVLDPSSSDDTAWLRHYLRGAVGIVVLMIIEAGASQLTPKNLTMYLAALPNRLRIRPRERLSYCKL